MIQKETFKSMKYVAVQCGTLSSGFKLLMRDLASYVQTHTGWERGNRSPNKITALMNVSNMISKSSIFLTGLYEG